MKVKTQDLEGPALDWAVGTANGGLYQPASARGAFWIWPGEPVKYSKAPPAYSTDWAQGGPIIERELMSIVAWVDESGKYTERAWAVDHPATGASESYGHTPLIAAMRRYVASKLGDEIEIPEALC